MKLVYAAAAAAALPAVSPAKAQVVDMSTITYADFSARSPEQMANIMFWLEGYYTEDDEPTTIDFAEFKAPGILRQQPHGRIPHRCGRDHRRRRQLGPDSPAFLPTTPLALRPCGMI